jgi:hypothetical protein
MPGGAGPCPVWTVHVGGGKLAWSAGGASQDRGPERGPALFGTQEQVDADLDLVERAVISVGVAAKKESDMR